MAELFDEVSNFFFLLSEPTRLKILHSLCHGERPVGDIVAAIEATQANVSRQLNMLFRARILARRKDGTEFPRFQKITNPATIAQLEDRRFRAGQVLRRIDEREVARHAGEAEVQLPVAHVRRAFLVGLEPQEAGRADRQGVRGQVLREGG